MSAGVLERQLDDDRLDETFAALANSTRRAILARLADGELSVNEIAEPFELTLPAVSKHIKVLERAGLIVRGRHAQYRPCAIDPAPLEDPVHQSVGLGVLPGIDEVPLAPATEPDRARAAQGGEQGLVVLGGAAILGVDPGDVGEAPRAQGADHAVMDERDERCRVTGRVLG